MANAVKIHAKTLFLLNKRLQILVKLDAFYNSVPRYMGKTGQILKTQRISRNTCRKKVCSYEFQSGIAKFVNLLFRKASMGIYRVTSAYFLHSIRH